MLLDLVDTSAVGLAGRMFPLFTGWLTERQFDIMSRVWYGMVCSFLYGMVLSISR